MPFAATEKRPLLLVLGPGKSGTTALFFCLKQSAEQHFDAEFPSLFEPKTAADIGAFTERFGIVKMLVERYLRTARDFVERFDKRVFISRDPRDNVISRLVYYAGTRLKAAEPRARETVLQKFLIKERDPEAVSVVELFAAMDPIMGFKDGALRARKTACTPASFLANEDLGFFCLRYEDFLDGRMARLRDYMGFQIVTDFTVAPRLDRVSRTRAHGYWRNWFTDEDYAYFVEPVAEDIRCMGYEDLEPHRGPKTISSKEISEYLARQLGAKSIEAV